MGRREWGEAIRLLRVHQWIKSGFVFTGYFFVEGWRDPTLTWRVLLAALAFALCSSGVYIFNDFCDREEDRRHPRKCHRPLAAGTVPAGLALAGMVLLVGSALGLVSRVSALALVLLVLYLALNAAYSLALKRVVLLDVFLLSSGYILRILVGTVGVGIPPSHWLILCAIMLALFLGFGKRRAELQSSGSQGREVLGHYTERLLDSIMSATAGAVLVTYALYTVDETTVRQHHTQALIYTVPLVAYGLFRFLQLVDQQGTGEDVSRELFEDPHLLVAALVWLLVVVWILS